MNFKYTGCLGWSLKPISINRKVRIIFQCLDALVERHGEVARETYKEGVVVKWNQDRFSHGGFVAYGVGQRHELKVKKSVDMYQLLITFTHLLL